MRDGETGRMHACGGRQNAWHKGNPCTLFLAWESPVVAQGGIAGMSALTVKGEAIADQDQ